MGFTVATPMLAPHRYEGTVCRLARPLDLLDPKAAFVEPAPPAVELAYTAVSPVSGGEPREPRRRVGIGQDRAERTGVAKGTRAARARGRPGRRQRTGGRSTAIGCATTVGPATGRRPTTAGSR
jgi:hypothetical protein